MYVGSSIHDKYNIRIKNGDGGAYRSIVANNFRIKSLDVQNCSFGCAIICAIICTIQ